MFLFNMTRMLGFEGIQFRFIWGWLIFFSMSACFIEAGRFLLNKVISFKANEVSRLESFSLRWFVGSWVCGMIWFALGLAGLYFTLLAHILIIPGLILGTVRAVPILRKSIQKEFFTDLLKHKSNIVFCALLLFVLTWSILSVYRAKPLIGFVCFGIGPVGARNKNHISF